MKLPFHIDLSEKTAVVTGGGGVLCSMFAKALAKSGAKVAILDLKTESADKVAREICAQGGIAKGYAANVLKPDEVNAAHTAIVKELGQCDILINGAGGNNPKGTTDREYFDPEDLKNSGLATFFDLDPAGIEFVFNLNFLGTIIPTQIFARDMAQHEHGNIINISSMNAFRPLTKIPAYSGGIQSHPMACGSLFHSRYPGKCHSPRFLCDQPEPVAFI